MARTQENDSNASEPYKYLDLQHKYSTDPLLFQKHRPLHFKLQPTKICKEALKSVPVVIYHYLILPIRPECARQPRFVCGSQKIEDQGHDQGPSQGPSQERTSYRSRPWRPWRNRHARYGR